MTGSWHLVGDDAVLVDLPDADAVTRLAARLRAAPPDGVVDVVPAERTVLVRGSARGRVRWAPAVRRVAESLAGSTATPGSFGSPALSGSPASFGSPASPALPASPDDAARVLLGRWGSAPRLVEIPVVYDGADLAEVAHLTGLTPDEVVARHVGGRYRVAFGGFVPGFAYLVGLDPVLVVPRLATPRTRVPAGAVAIGGEYTAVYPRTTPGGWRLLGRTEAVMFDPARDDRPALLVAGDEVRFVEVGRPDHGGDGGRDHNRERIARPTAMTTPPDRNVPDRTTGLGIEVLATGPLLLVQDGGRAGLAEFGVPRSGAADPEALRTANRLVGNRPDAAALEVLLGGLVVRFGATAAIALTGARAPARLDGRPVPFDRAVRAAAGATLELDAPPAGLRSWLAVRGGIDVPAVLGSRSTDVLSSLGPEPVAAGDVLPIGHAVDGLPEVGLPDEGIETEVSAPRPLSGEPGPAAPVVLGAYPGPRLDLLDDDSRRRLCEQVWVVLPDSNRVALRLDGPPLVRTDASELPSEGLVLGAVQVPHDGRPVVFGPDHPVTGGYPVVAVLTAKGVARAAQCRPGDLIRLAIREHQGWPRPEVTP